MGGVSCMQAQEGSRGDIRLPHQRGNEPRQEQGDRVEHETAEGVVGEGFFGIAFGDDVHGGMAPGAGRDGGGGFGWRRGGGPGRGHWGGHWEGFLARLGGRRRLRGGEKVRREGEERRREKGEGGSS